MVLLTYLNISQVRLVEGSCKELRCRVPKGRRKIQLGRLGAEERALPERPNPIKWVKLCHSGGIELLKLLSERKRITSLERLPNKGGKGAGSRLLEEKYKVRRAWSLWMLGEILPVRLL